MCDARLGWDGAEHGLGWHFHGRGVPDCSGCYRCQPATNADEVSCLDETFAHVSRVELLKLLLCNQSTKNEKSRL